MTAHRPNFHRHRYRRPNGRFEGLKLFANRLGTTITLAAVVLVVVVFYGNRAPSVTYYPNCDAARAAGVAPINAGEPGYRPPLDADGDGIACEPYAGM